MTEGQTAPVAASGAGLSPPGTQMCLQGTLASSPLIVDAGLECSHFFFEWDMSRGPTGMDQAPGSTGMLLVFGEGREQADL